ncbi:MAG: 2-oxoglutarate and iron-dependent oxygenase domain-containing protein [Pseudomonadota bacterium]
MIPILDWRDASRDPAGFAKTLGEACRETGFFLLTNHGVPAAAIDALFSVGDRFFARPEDEKAALSILANPHNRGWAAEGSESLDPASGAIDRKEAFNVGLDLSPEDPRVLAGEPFRGVNIWPEVDGFRDAALAYFNHALALGVALHRPIAEDLGLAPDYFAPHFDAPMATLRLLRYPGGGRGEGGEIGAGAHTDYGSLTLLMTDDEPGLEVRPRGGDWIAAPSAPGAFVVNIGDCLMRWSNDVYVSTPHRVRAPVRPRRSLAFFLDPNPDSVIAALPGTGAPKYPAVTGADYLRSRLDATYTPEPAI